MKYNLPAPKKIKRNTPDGPQVMEEDELRWMRKVRLPANKALIDSLEVGETAKIILSGKIEGLEMRERDQQKPRGEIEINVDSIETVGSAENPYEKMAKEDE